jgi:lipopolysaccharide export system protein LptC
MAELLHSRIVGGLKLVLPLTAVGLLSMLFLLPTEIDPSRALPLAPVDAEDLARDPRITAPRFSTVTDDGTAVTLTAATVRIAAGTGEVATAETVDMALAAPDGGVSLFRADHAVMDRAAGLVTLTGDVRFDSAAGYRIAAGRILVALDRTRAESPGPVTAKAPAGHIEAGGFLFDAGAEGAGQRLLFTGGVRLLYRPESGD